MLLEKHMSSGPRSFFLSKRVRKTEEPVRLGASMLLVQHKVANRNILDFLNPSQLKVLKEDLFFSSYHEKGYGPSGIVVSLSSLT